MSSEIKVSVIMPIYNASNYLRPALESVLAQTLSEIEIICIDDGSTDKSLSIIKEYHEKDQRIRIVTENNAGVSTARNKGIIRARGEYLMFLDADDFYEPNLLERLYVEAVKNELDIAVCEYDVYNTKQSRFTPAVTEDHSEILSGGEIISKSEYPEYILQCMSGYVWNKLFRTSLIKDKGLMFAPELYVFEDVHFICTALAYAGRIKGITEVLVHHRIYSEQSRPKLFRKYFKQVPKVYLQIKEFLTTNGMYVPLAISYLNLSASRCYKIYNILWSDAKADFWDLLHNGYADSFGWYKHESDDFENKDVCDFAANVGLYTHAQYVKRMDKGRELNIDRMSKNSLNKKIKSHKFFGRMMRRIGSVFKRSKKNKGE